MKKEFILKGNICYSEDKNTLKVAENSYVICVDGRSKGVFGEIPEAYAGLPITDYGEKLIVPGFTDLHIHAPQYSFRSLGMDLELLEWLETNTFPEEAKFADLRYADQAYEIFVEDLKKAPQRECAHLQQSIGKQPFF